MMIALEHSLNRTVVIGAPPETVFRFFTDSTRWAAWWGAGSTVDPRPGGRLYVRYPDGTEALGEVLEVVSPERFTFTYGYASGKPIAPGASRVTIRLASHAEGTRLTLTHDFADADVREPHVQGWRYQLSVFANVVADEANASATRLVDEWFRAWSVADEKEREQVLGAIASMDVHFRDRFGSIDGLDDLVAHIGGALRFMPGVTMNRSGDIRHCQGTALADWIATGANGQPRGAGINVFVLNSDGQIASVTGFWNTNR